MGYIVTSRWSAVIKPSRKYAQTFLEKFLVVYNCRKEDIKQRKIINFLAISGKKQK
jgi:hypothetical protein